MIIQRKNKILVIFIVLFFFLLYNLQSVVNHYLFRTNALDYGFHLQAFWHFIHFTSGPLTVFGHTITSFFQIHPSFTLVYLTPLCYLLKPVLGSYTLIIVQNIFIIIGGIYTYKVLLYKSNNYLISVIAILHYFLLWGHYSAIAFEYIDATVAATFIPVFFYYFYKSKYFYAGLAFVFTLTSRENMPIWFIFIGLFFAIEYFKTDKIKFKLSLGIITISLVYLVFIFSVLFPFFADDTYTYNRFQYSQLGSNIPEVLKYIVLHPISTIKLLFVNHLGNSVYDGIKIEFWTVFMLSGGIILFLKPKYFLIFIPLIGQKLFSDDYQMWGINIFYSIEIVSVLTIASYLIIIKFKNYKITYIISFLLLLSTFVTTITMMNHRKSKWYNSSKEKIYTASFYKSDLNIKEVYSTLKLIPDDAVVCAGEKLVAHLSFRDKIYYFPNINDSEYIVLLLKGSTYPLKIDEFNQKVSQLLSSNKWEILTQTSDIILLRKK
jgi:uncharacterized membrane protein